MCCNNVFSLDLETEWKQHIRIENNNKNNKAKKKPKRMERLGWYSVEK